MKITQTDEGTSFSIQVKTDDATKEVMFREGEPEDNTFSRDLNDAYFISDLIKLAYNAGKNGEDIEWISINESEEEL